MKLKKIAALALAGVMTVSALTGCGVMKNATAATMKDGVKVTMGVANFMCMYQQASTDEMYRQYYGDNAWESDTFGMGTTNLASTRDSVMDELHRMYTLKAHMKDYDVELSDKDEAKIKQAAKDFIAANDNSTLKELGANQEIVEEVLRLHTIDSRMHQAFLDKAEVTDEEANMRAYTMVSIPYKTTTDAEGKSTEIPEDQAATLKKSAQAIADAAKKGTDLSKAATDNGQTAAPGTYDKDDETLDKDVKAALDKLKEGQVTDLITTDTNYVIARLDKETDKEATENNRKTVKEEKFDKQLEKWQKDDGWTVNKKQVEKIRFRNKFKTTDKSKESTGTSETTAETQATETQTTETQAAETQTTEKK